ncbi:MAG: SpoIIE family protein phosphatase [Planctomycetes bacterium]|nr:SpoIIE family protein phosphatase [Planctomycetota bacterium]
MTANSELPAALANHSDIRKVVGDLAAILEVSKALSSEKDFDKLLGLIISETVRVLDSDRGSLFLVDEEKGELWSKIAQKAEIKEIRFPIGKGIAGFVAQSQQVVNITDAYNDSRFNPAFDKQTGYRTRTILCAPLLTNERKVIGVVQVLNKRDGVFTNYDEALVLALGSHAAVALDNARLVKHYLQKQMMAQALGIAKEIQVGLLPKKPPEVAAMDIAGWSLACDETGGDYYDYIELGDGRLGVVIGDVSGHGVGSALLMASARAFLRGLIISFADPSDVLFRLNNLLAKDMEAGRFMTLLLGILDPKKRTFIYTSAGHDAPVLHRGATGEIKELESTGFPLGIIEDGDFPKAEEIQLDAGDQLLFMTDGVWEAMDREQQPYGRERMCECLRRNHVLASKDIIQCIYRDQLDFIRGAPQHDDITMVLITAK